MTISLATMTPVPLLHSLALLLSTAETINNEAMVLASQHRPPDGERRAGLANTLSDKVIANYANHIGFSGGSLALMGSISGLRQSVYLYGGLTSDMALVMKYPVDMTMAIACHYGHAIGSKAVQHQCQMVAASAMLDCLGAPSGTLQHRPTPCIDSLYRSVEDLFAGRISGNSAGMRIDLGSSRKDITVRIGMAAKRFFASLPAAEAIGHAQAV